MCFGVMQEEEVSAGKPFCGWFGLAEGEEGKRGYRGEGRDKGGPKLPKLCPRGQSSSQHRG